MAVDATRSGLEIGDRELKEKTRLSAHDLCKNSKPLPKTRDHATSNDVILPIKPEYVRLIVDRKKNYEYRKYKLRPTIERLWLYETAPISAIRYVMSTASPRRPGEVCDSSGIGNDDFDAGLKESKYGYPVLAVSRLPDILTKKTLEAKFGIKSLQGFRYVPKDILEMYPIDPPRRI
ncbi:hypothetical protein HDU67_005372 [Dinochytrium kinnereticum]|nr:hypothetical protein HDU67_005372 [Dinochytrium kinnereticum]